MRLRTTCLLLLLVAATALAVGPRLTVAEEPVDPGYGETEGPVYFVISFEDTFLDKHFKKNEAIILNIGSLVGGDEVGDTRFVTNEALMGITLPDGRKDPTFEELQDNAATVFGSFYALDEQGFHTAVPTPGEVDPEIQEAVFLASNSGDIDALLAVEPFPSAEQIVSTIEQYLPAGSDFDKEHIHEHLFGSAIQLSATVSAAEGEGEIFPYEPNSESLFVFKIRFTEDEEYEQDIRLQIPIDIQSPINVDNKNGELPVIVGDTEVFEAVDVIPTSVYFSGVDADGTEVRVYADTYQLNGNGELVMKFSVPALVTANVLDATSTELTIFGDLEFVTAEGVLLVSPIKGTDSITVSSNND